MIQYAYIRGRDMEIAALVCNKKLNYDSTLQTYSIYEYLKGQGNQVQIIDYNFIKEKNTKKNEMLYNFLNNNIALTLTRYKNLNQVEQNLPLADKYIVVNGNYSDLTLKIDEKECIVYRAKDVSLPELNYLSNNYSKISTSFESNNDNAQKVVDPLFLLPKEKWYDIISNKSGVNLENDYVFVYSEVVTKDMIQYANALAQKNNYKVYILSDKVQSIFYKGKRLNNIEPFDLINLISSAHDVITSCDDGIKLSVIFEKNIHIFSTQNEEQIELINELKVENRVVNNIDSILSGDMEYEESNKTIDKIKEESYKFLEV